MAKVRFGRVPEPVVCDPRLARRDLRVYAALSMFADREGRCYPKRERLEELTGIATANITKATSRLRMLGHIEKVGSGGRNRPSQYLLTAFSNGIPADTVSGQKGIAADTVSGQKGIAADTVSGQKGVTADTPSEQTRERTDQGEGEPPSSVPLASVNIEQVIELYNELLPELPRANLPTEEMARSLTDLQKKRPKAAAEDWWRSYFRVVKRCPYLLGQRTRFIANLGWLVRPDSMAKVINGDYLDGDGGEPRPPARRELGEALSIAEGYFPGAI